MLRSKPQRWIPELRFGYPPLRNSPKCFWEKLGNFLESFGGSQRQLCIKIRPLLQYPSAPAQDTSELMAEHSMKTIQASLGELYLECCPSIPNRSIPLSQYTFNHSPSVAAAPPFPWSEVQNADFQRLLRHVCNHQNEGEKTGSMLENYSRHCRGFCRGVERGSGSVLLGSNRTAQKEATR